MPVPEIFQRSDTLEPREFRVTGDQMIIGDARKRLLTPLTVRALNALLLVPENREDWTKTADVEEFWSAQSPSYGFFHPNNFYEQWGI